jgi:hypothetical protein
MEFSHEEKERIIAEEKLRYETRENILSQGGSKSCGCGTGGSDSHGACGCGSFIKGLILGLVLAAIVGYFCNRHCFGNDGGRCYYGSTMMQNQTPPEPPKK